MLRVPFGLRKIDNVWVGPEDVEQSGLACGCICPYCKLPLKKNVCTERVDHFSHHTRQQQGKVARDCEYSFWVACATMGRQLLEKGGELKTPTYSKAIRIPVGSWYQFYEDQNETVEIAPAASISFTSDDVAIGEIVDQRLTDAVITVHGVRILVFFTHPERQSVNIDGISHEKTGVLVINLLELLATYKALRGAESFKEKIHICLFDAINNKHWLWHPRETRLMAAAEERLNKAAQAINPKHAYSAAIIQDQGRAQPALVGSRSTPPRQSRWLTGRWCDIRCKCGNNFRDFVRNDDLEHVPCRKCGLSGHENLQILL
jgi:hypothetical protein